MPMVKEVPIWEKSNLTLEEAAAYSGIGINKLRKMTDEQNCQFVLWKGLCKRYNKFAESFSLYRKGEKNAKKKRS